MLLFVSLSFVYCFCLSLSLSPLSLSPSLPPSLFLSLSLSLSSSLLYSLPPTSSLPLLEVHKTKKPYRKSSPGPPDFRVMIFSPSDPFPSVSLLKQLVSLTPSSPLLSCVADGCSLSYYTLSHGSVPALQ